MKIINLSLENMVIGKRWFDPRSGKNLGPCNFEVPWPAKPHSTSFKSPNTPLLGAARLRVWHNFKSLFLKLKIHHLWFINCQRCQFWLKGSAYFNFPYFFNILIFRAELDETLTCLHSHIRFDSKGKHSSFSTTYFWGKVF